MTPRQPPRLRRNTSGSTGETLDIEYETPDGKWHEEVASGQDRPATEVQDIDPDQPS